MKIYFFISGIIIGIIISLQLNANMLVHRNTKIHEKSDTNKIFEYLESKHQDQNEIYKKLVSEEQELLKNISSNLQEELKQEQVAAGLTEVTGPGIIIRLDANTLSSQIHASDIRDLINVFLSLNVEAISLNGQRVIFKTPIISVGENILMNNELITPPIEIKVIGDKNFILSALETKTILTNFRKKINNDEVVFEIQIAKLLHIPEYLY